MASFKGKVIIITGASSGIGEATAYLFAAEKAKVVLAARRLENLQKVAAECVNKGLTADEVLTVPCDVGNPENLQTLVDETVKKFGQIDVLVNNAGKTVFGPLVTMKEEDLHDVMNTNFTAAFRLSRLCAPHLIKTQGAIVNISSIAGHSAGPNFGAYCVSKAAINMFTEVLALELAPQKVRVNCVSPGYIDTHFGDAGQTSDALVKAYHERLKYLQPLRGGPGKPEEVARAIKFLASEDASFVTGNNLFVDSGYHCRLPV